MPEKRIYGSGSLPANTNIRYSGTFSMLRAMARGAAWMIGFRFADRALGFISTLVLARLLVPEDFGLVAMAMSVIALIELAGAFGFDTALIQHRDPQRPQFDTAYTLNVLVGIGCAALVVLASWPTAAFFNEPRLVPVMQVLAVAWAVQGFVNVGTVMFRRNMEFHREFRYLLARRLVTFVPTLVAAFLLRSYWALIIGIVLGRVAMVALSYLMHPYRPQFSLRASRELMSFSVWMLLGTLLEFFTLRLSHFIVGRQAGSRPLGLYTIAYEIGTLPTSELLAPVNRAIIPGFARMAQDPAQLRAGYLDVLGVTMLLAVPAAFGIAAIAEPLVLVLLTEKWLDAVPLLRVMAFLGAVAAVMSSIYPVYYALGRPKLTVILNGLRLGIVLPAMLVGAHYYGVIGVAWADLVATLLMVPISLGVASSVLGIPARQFVSRAWRPVAGSALMYYAVSQLLHGTPYLASASEVLRLVSGIVAGATVYAAAILILWLLTGRGAGTESRLLDFARNRAA